MSAPSPEAVRARFQTLIEEGLSGRAAALRLKLSPATGARWGLSIRRTGRARVARQGRPRGKGKLDTHRSFLVELIEQDGDMTIFLEPHGLNWPVRWQTRPAFRCTLMRLADSCANSVLHTKNVGRHRATPRTGKETTRRLVRTSLASSLGTTGSSYFH